MYLIIVIHNLKYSLHVKDTYVYCDLYYLRVGILGFLLPTHVY